MDLAKFATSGAANRQPMNLMLPLTRVAAAAGEVAPLPAARSATTDAGHFDQRADTWSRDQTSAQNAKNGTAYLDVELSFSLTPAPATPRSAGADATTQTTEPFLGSMDEPAVIPGAGAPVNPSSMVETSPSTLGDVESLNSLVALLASAPAERILSLAGTLPGNFDTTAGFRNDQGNSTCDKISDCTKPQHISPGATAKPAAPPASTAASVLDAHAITASNFKIDESTTRGAFKGDAATSDAFAPAAAAQYNATRGKPATADIAGASNLAGQPETSLPVSTCQRTMSDVAEGVCSSRHIDRRTQSSSHDESAHGALDRLDVLLQGFKSAVSSTAPDTLHAPAAQ